MMTAHELARKLLAGPDLPVHLSYPAGDYWRTAVAPPVARVTQGDIKDSDYHGMPRLVVLDHDREQSREAIILG